ncbi:MAG: agmatine deiminase family protein [Bacteroidetes bacterium]|nr:agmatine deiminase family protein [Bacteroidota bacterium]
MNTSPKSLGYRFPAEWERHSATWLSWPHKEASWPGKIDSIYPVYADFIKLLATGEKVRVNVSGEKMEAQALQYLKANGTDLSQVEFYPFPTNDAWCRDHGPAFLTSKTAPEPKIIVDWDYNAWGDKYPPYDLDDIIPTLIGRKFGYPVFKPGIVMEGGSVEFNGKGTLLTTTACLLNENRNPHLSQGEIETFLREFYAVDHILWLGDGIVGDDTDGHIDDLTRFVSADTVVTVVEENRQDENYPILQDNLKELNRMRLESGKQMTVVELPMPDPVIFEDQRLPASYANFYIANSAVIVPTYRCRQDDRALQILSSVFSDRPVVGLDSVDIIWGLGSFHCLSQQEPE